MGKSKVLYYPTNIIWIQNINNALRISVGLTESRLNPKHTSLHNGFSLVFTWFPCTLFLIHCEMYCLYFSRSTSFLLLGAGTSLSIFPGWCKLLCFVLLGVLGLPAKTFSSRHFPFKLSLYSGHLS